jgi:hypothetical protein
LRVAGVDDADMRAGAGEAFGDGFANAASAACDESCLAVEILEHADLCDCSAALGKREGAKKQLPLRQSSK